MRRNVSQRTRSVLIVSSTGISLGYVTPTAVDVAAAIAHVVIWVTVLSAVGWALLLLELLESLGVS